METAVLELLNEHFAAPVVRATTAVLDAFAAAASNPNRSLGSLDDYAWLRGRSIVDPDFERAAIHSANGPLTRVDADLDGDLDKLAATDRRRLPHDLFAPSVGVHIEVDEVQHFASAREPTLQRYPEFGFGEEWYPAGFDVDGYLRLIAEHRGRADRAFAHRQAATFPGERGRQRQRAFNDAVRDFAIGEATGRPVIRIPILNRSDPQAGIEFARPYLERFLGVEA